MLFLISFDITPCLTNKFYMHPKKAKHKESLCLDRAAKHGNSIHNGRNRARMTRISADSKTRKLEI